jgi:hypothetical protein
VYPVGEDGYEIEPNDLKKISDRYKRYHRSPEGKSKIMEYKNSSNGRAAIKRYMHRRKHEYGFEAINACKFGHEGHHLHLENNHDFAINLPDWLHRLIYHNSRSGRGMDSINSVALDYWINEDVYKAYWK